MATPTYASLQGNKSLNDLWQQFLQTFLSGQNMDGTTFSGAGPTASPSNDSIANPTTVVASGSFLFIRNVNSGNWERAVAASNQQTGTTGMIAVGPYLLDSGSSNNRFFAAGVGVTGDNMGGTLLSSQPSSSPTGATAAANTAVVTTYNAVASQRHRLTILGCSWSGAAATTGSLLVQDGATTILSVDIPLALNTPHWVPLPPGGIQGTANTNMVITLAAGGALAVGKLNTAKITG